MNTTLLFMGIGTQELLFIALIILLVSSINSIYPLVSDSRTL